MIILILSLFELNFHLIIFINSYVSDVIRKINIFVVMKNFRLLISKLTNFNLKNFNSHSNHQTIVRKYRAKIN